MANRLTTLKYLSLSFFITPSQHSHAELNTTSNIYIYNKSADIAKEGNENKSVQDYINRHTGESINTGNFSPALLIKNNKLFLYTLASNAIDDRYEALSITAEAHIIQKQGSEFLLSYQTQNYYPNFISIGKPVNKKPLKLLNPVRVEMTVTLTPEGHVKITECSTKEPSHSQWRKSIDYLGLCEPPTYTLFNVTKYVQGRKEWAHLF